LTHSRRRLSCGFSQPKTGSNLWKKHDPHADDEETPSGSPADDHAMGGAMVHARSLLGAISKLSS
jgi:hypothetical protein